MHDDRFIAIVQREIDAPDGATARKAVRAAFETLSERLVAGLIKTVRAQLPAEVAKDLSLQQPHQPFDADEFVRRIARRAGVDTGTAEKYAKAVFLTLSRVLDPEIFRALLGQLAEDYRPLTEKARRPANQPQEFLRRVADRAGLGEERAFAVSEAVLETLAERIAGGEVDDLVRELPRDLRPALERGRARSGGQGRRMNLDEFLDLVAERADATPGGAREYATAVLATVHDAVTEKEFLDLLSELPRSYVELTHV